MRVIAAVRLSKMTEVTTSVDTQTENLQAFAQRNGHTIVALTEDLDVSGGKPIRQRPGVGPWFLRPDEWDGLLIYAIDRAFRNHYDFVTTWYDYFKKYDKKLIAVSEDIDMSTDGGEMMAHMRVMFAQSELRKISERNQRKARKLLTSGFLSGGTSDIKWGYRKERLGNRWILVPDEEQVEEVHRTVYDYLEGKSLRQLAFGLGISQPGLGARFRSPTLKGWIMYKGEPVRDDDGLPLLREPIIGEALWDQVQETMAQRAKGAGIPRDATDWLNVIFCGLCGEKLYRGGGGPGMSDRQRRNGMAWPSTGKTYHYWRHKYERYGDYEKKCKAHLSALALERQITPLVLRAFEGAYVPVILRAPAVSHQDEILRIEQSIADMEKEFIENGGSVETLARITSKLAARAAELRAQERPARTSVQPGDQLFVDKWLAAPNDAERARLLRAMNMRLIATPTGRGKVHLKGQYGDQDWTTVLARLREHGDLVGDPIDT